MRNPVFVCEDSNEGKDLFKLLLKKLLSAQDVPVWGSQGVGELRKSADVARRRYAEAKVVYVADGDRLAKKEYQKLREKLRADVVQLGGACIVVRKNMEDLGRRCLAVEHLGQFDRERSKSKRNALRFAMEHIDPEIARAQPELLDVALILSCGIPQQSSL